MDIMIPYLGRITRLQLESKGAFHIAGLKDANIQKIELEKRQQREVEKRKKAAESMSDKDQAAVKEDDDSDKHLDTWA
ncbi:hypothetical protein [Pseudoalteromonas mariniglutinosa]|uniref:hypothetical protein n=1 Tax=Pseudoalteromonas mariniglutinosa TaxID=206042 RepID=UPI00384B506F